MEIVGNRKYVEVPGNKTHELPPLLLHADHEVKRLDRVMQMASKLIESEDLMASLPMNESAAAQAQLEQRKMDLAVNLVEQYLGLIAHWNWGDSILGWIRQCETTFESRRELRNLLQPDLWPHAGRRSFVNLLSDKCVPGPGIDIERGVGFRLTFRQPPPLVCFSDQFLFYLKSSIGSIAYETWASMSPEPVAALPPERFSFEVVKM